MVATICETETSVMISRTMRNTQASKNTNRRHAACIRNKFLRSLVFIYLDVLRARRVVEIIMKIRYCELRLPHSPDYLRSFKTKPIIFKRKVRRNSPKTSSLEIFCRISFSSKCFSLDFDPVHHPKLTRPTHRVLKSLSLQVVQYVP